MNTKLFHLLFAVTANSCDISESNTPVGNQNILFEVEYKNFAWGYMHSGFYINKYGEIFSYNYDHNSSDWQSNNDGYYSELELSDKYNSNRRLIKNIDYREVAVKRELIPRLILSGDTEPVQTGADMGALSYICYSYDNRKKKYKEIILLREGDWSFRKQSAAADSLVNWLKNITDFFGKRA